MSRRIVLYDAAGQLLATMDITGLANANAAAVMQLVVEALCNRGSWHAEQTIHLAPWGPD